jgi:MFS family permease
VAQICSWGTIYYSFPLIAERMEHELGWSRTSLYAAASVGLLFAALAAISVGRAIDRGQGRWIMAGGSVLSGLLFIAWSQVQDLWGLFAIATMLGALQATTLYEAAFAVIARRLGADKARGGITALTLWGGFASTVFIPVIQYLIDSVGWRDTLIVLGAVNIGICATIYAIAIRPALDVAHTAHPAGEAGPADDKPVRKAARSPVFWLLAIAFAAHAMTFSALTFHLYPLLLERGFAPGAVVAAMALIGPAQVGGRIAVTILARGASMRLVGSCAVAAFAGGFVALAMLPPGFAGVAFATVVYGASNGVLTIVRGASVPEMVTKQNYGAVAGAMNIPATIGRALSPLAAAYLWSLGNSYGPVTVAMIIGSLVLVGCFWTASAVFSANARLAGAKG